MGRRSSRNKKKCHRNAIKEPFPLLLICALHPFCREFFLVLCFLLRFKVINSQNILLLNFRVAGTISVAGNQITFKIAIRYLGKRSNFLLLNSHSTDWAVPTSSFFLAPLFLSPILTDYVTDYLLKF